jgi:hypothetical protein
MHIGLISAGALMPRVVGMSRQLSNLPLFLRQLFWVYYSFIGMCLASFGLGTFLLAGTLAQGGVLACSICGFLALFWTARLAAATIFDLKPYLTSTPRRVGYWLLNGVFVYLPLVYLLAAFKGDAK